MLISNDGIEEKDVDPDMIRAKVKELMEDPELLRTMGERAREQAPVKTTDIIYEEILKTMK